jgi:hypothetical protein
MGTAMTPHRVTPWANGPRRVAVAALLGAMLVVGAALADATAFPGRQAVTAIPEGIRIETLAAALDLPFRPRETVAVLQRYTYAPGAQLDLPYVGPVLMYVESGTLSLDGVGNQVDIVYPPDVVEQPLTGETIAESQVGEAPLVGEQAEVGMGGSVYAATGEIGPTRNGGDEPLVLLVVVFVSEPRPDVTKVAEEGAPQAP